MKIGILRTLIVGFSLVVTATITVAQSVSVDFIREQAALSNLDGFNLAGMPGIFDCNFAAPSNASGYEYVKALDPQLLRFPGGTISQYAHLLQGTGYGLDSTELTIDYTGSQLAAFLQLYADEQQISCRYIDGFLDLYAALPSSNVEVLFVANISTASVQENVDALNFLITNNVNVVGVEMGNETYRDTIRFPTVTAYLNAALPYAQAIDQAAPFLKLGWVAAPPLTGNRAIYSDAFKAKIQNWNNLLAQQMSNALVDAFVIHLYANGYVPGALVSFQNNYDNDNLSTLNNPFNFATQQLHGYVNDSLQDIFTEYRAFFGNTEKFWLTEWGPSRPTDLIGNTMLDATVAFMWFDRLNRYNAVLNQQIEYACKQKLAGPNTNAANMISPKGLFDDTSNDYVRRTSYWSSVLNGSLFRDGGELLRADVQSSGVSLPVHIEGYTGQNGEIRIHFANSNPQQVNFDWSNMRFFLSNGSPLVFTPTSQYVIDRLSGTSIYSSAGSTDFLLNNINYSASNKPPFELDTLIKNVLPSSQQSFMLPPYSIGTIRFAGQFVVGVDELTSSHNQLQVYPNPVHEGNEFRISRSNGLNENIELGLFNVAGALVKRIELGSSENILVVRTDGLESGVYYLKSFNGAIDKVASLKLVLVE